MNLSNLEKYINERILERGRIYFRNGQVTSLKTDDHKHYKAKVDGSQIYHVEVTLDEKQDILDSYCDCPYDEEEYCKHQAAVFYAMNEGALQETNDLPTILATLEKEQLISVILGLADTYPDIEKRLIFQFGDSKDEIEASKKLIREYINAVKRGGFIDWRNASHAVQGAELTLEKARGKIEHSETEGAVQLALVVLPIVIKMLQYCDDSDGSVGQVINGALQTIDMAIAANIHQLSEKEQKKLFDMISKEALKKHYDDWSDWRYDLLGTCVYFSKNKDLRKKLEKHLLDLERSMKDSWSSRYDKKRIKLIELKIIETCDGAEAWEEFLYRYIQFSDFRKKAIDLEFERENYQKAIQLCLEGETKDHEYRGLVHQWKENRYHAYELLHDVENQRKLARELLFLEEFKFYLKLKELYDPQDWQEVLRSILADFEKRPSSQTYLQILKEENLSVKILEYCQKARSYIVDLYPYLMKNHLEEARDLFVQYIMQSAADESDRRGYKKVCKNIKIYKQAFGAVHANGLISDLKQQHARRPAFLDELGKIK